MPTPEEIAAEALATQKAADEAAAAAKTDDKGDKPEDKKTEDKGDDKPDPFADLRGKDLSADEVAKLLEKLTAANGEAASYRHKLREAELASETETAKKIREAKESGEAEAMAKYQPIFIKTAAVSELTAAGAASGHDSLIKLLDKDKLEVQADGTVKGIKAEVERVKKEFPALFPGETPSRKPRPGVRIDGGDKTTSTKKSSAQIHAERVLGNA